jgi:hypothetical protein
MKSFNLKKTKTLLSVTLIVVFFLSISGCITERATQTDDPLKYTNTVTRYINEYGNDYTTKQIIKSNTIYDVITWPSKGVTITAVMETGIVTNMETFDSNSGYLWMD